jgi:hypothetical protein
MTATASGLIALSRIKDGGAQTRVEMNPDIINEYAEAMLNGAVFPPIIVYDDEIDCWLGDGYHRFEAARKLGQETISGRQAARGSDASPRSRMVAPV